ncbi:lysophospholipid acyltransferase family protein [candidate division KSB1 bacterium]|nr:lysophospholipid acyltransferase family protein [candidate division KSB1 bacterium]MBL7094203.1 lysophospholipid acyltransferase family protein [candidate division KSB1 bacterium]
MKKPFRKFTKRIKNWIIYAAVRSGVLWMLCVQRATTMKFLQAVSMFGYYIVPSERKKTIKNLTKVFGDTKSPEQIKQMAKDVFRNLGRNMADAFAIPRFKRYNIDNFVKAEGLEHLSKALENGTGAIALTGHIGNWELLGAYLAIKGFPINVVGAPIYDSRLDELVVNNRLHSGMKYIARGTATRDIIRALRAKEIVGILIDQDTKRVDGIFVDFLGHPAYTPIGPVVLAMKTKAVIVPMAIHTKKHGKHYIKVKPQLPLRFSGDVEKDRIYNTKLCNDALSDFILENPTQWVWMHERWKTKPGD